MIDIQAGDVVVCVDDDWIEPIPADPKRGDVLRVTDVDDDEKGLFFAFAGKPQDTAWAAHRFRKVRPATDRFTTQIKAIRPIKQREEA